MSQENVEIVRRAFEAVNRRDDVEEILSYIDPESELHSAVIGGAEGTSTAAMKASQVVRRNSEIASLSSATSKRGVAKAACRSTLQRGGSSRLGAEGW
jgi:hypothetical protein